MFFPENRSMREKGSYRVVAYVRKCVLYRNLKNAVYCGKSCKKGKTLEIR